MGSAILHEKRVHHGVVLNLSQSGFGKGASAMGSIFTDDEYPTIRFLFYTGAEDAQWSRSAIGVAVSTNGLEFKKKKDPLIRGDQGSFCAVQALNPTVTRLKNRFYMIFSGKPMKNSPRRIGISWADDPKGPWNIIGELIKPAYFWEGNGIDNGPSIVKLDNETILLYYSSLTSPKAYDIFTFLRRYPIRRIGILKVRIRGTSHSSIEAMRFSGNPIKHLNGLKGSWNESVFCPGYTKLGNTHFLFPTGSTYSVGYPYRQYIGVATCNTPYFNKTDTQLEKLIDGPEEKHKIISNARSEIALDTPCPYLDPEEQKLHLYYSVADRADEKWKIALTTYDLCSKIE